MKLPIAWLVRLGLAGSCLVLAGCGRSDVPDPDSDSHAATEATPKAGGPPPAVALNNADDAPEPAAPAPEQAATPKGPPAAPAAGGGPEVASSGEPPAAATPPAADEPAAAKGDSTSSTSEMLALANGPAAPTESDKAPEGGDAAAQQPGAPGAPGAGPGAMMGNGGGGQQQQQMQQQQMQQQQQQMRAGQPGAGGRPGMGGMPGMPGMAAGPGGPGMVGGGFGPGNAENAPADFSNPIGGANAFLNALKAKDAKRLMEATALRAPQEAAAGNRKLFEAIAFEELAAEELDTLAGKLDGFRISGYNQQKSSSRIGITLTKQSGTSVLRRTITMRKEKAGWKVCDIGGQGELDKPIIIPGMRVRGRRR